MCIVRLQDTMLATIHQAIFSDPNLNYCVRSASMDIENKTFWKALYTLLRYVYPANELFVIVNPTCLPWTRSTTYPTVQHWLLRGPVRCWTMMICLDLSRETGVASNLNSLRFLALNSIMPVLPTLCPGPTSVKMALLWGQAYGSGFSNPILIGMKEGKSGAWLIYFWLGSQCDGCSAGLFCRAYDWCSLWCPWACCYKTAWTSMYQQ